MSYEEEFDNIIRKKADQLDFSFDENNWEKARQMIDHDRRSAGAAAKGRSNSWMYLLGFAAALTALLFWIRPGTQSLALASVTSNNSHQSTPHSSGEVISASNELAAAPAGKAEKPVGTNSAGGVATEQVVRDKQFKSSGNLDTEPSRSSLPLSSATEDNAPIDPSSETAAGSPEFPISRQGPVETHIAGTGSDQVTVSPVVPAEQNAIFTTTGSESQDHNEEIMELQLIGAGPLSPPDPVTRFVMHYDDYFKPGRNKTHFLSLYGGGFYNTGWQVQGQADGKGINGFAGIEYGFYLGRRITVSAGAQMFDIGHLSQPYHQATGTEYHFGSTHTGTVITLERLVYGAIPVNFGFRLNHHNSVQAGITIANPLAAMGTVRSYTELDGSRNYHHPARERKIYQGIGQAIFLTAGYSASLTRRIKVNASVVFGLNDMLDTRQTQGEQSLRGLRLGIHYAVFDK